MSLAPQHFMILTVRREQPSRAKGQDREHTDTAAPWYLVAEQEIDLTCQNPELAVGPRGKLHPNRYSQRNLQMEMRLQSCKSLDWGSTEQQAACWNRVLDSSTLYAWQATSRLNIPLWLDAAKQCSSVRQAGR
ncbi:hypothetical protein CGLO_14039 [Colletotrichum gloeosporioides Cg-14]|uniref:Uncharacterized protein n=1 Tax=Colletotrichum gloeosporioides (strain Cg-14) TaxID=1237896 RepID=T0K4L6_COLGC|nr:hypothetical protein CGLO_14039 [Colletotrichum gloeosporioides Cg-14]